MFWLSFPPNHREVIAAPDFFTLHTRTFCALRCLFAVEHGRRNILHFDVAEGPSETWALKRLGETFSEYSYN